MVYMGSKAKYRKYIVPILQKAIDDNNIETYIECFVGGANIIEDIKCKNRFGYDRSDTLIALLDLAANDFSKIPSQGSRELWDRGKEYVKNGIKPEDMTLAEIGAIEFLGGYRGRGFPGGYATPSATKDYYAAAYKNLEKQAPKLKGIIFKAQNYWELNDVENSVIYLDPPYQNTKTYGYASFGKMDYTHFWNWVREISKNNIVFVSEQIAPEDFEIIWEKEVKRTMDKNNNFSAIERLFKIK